MNPFYNLNPETTNSYFIPVQEPYLPPVTVIYAPEPGFYSASALPPRGTYELVSQKPLHQYIPLIAPPSIQYQQPLQIQQDILKTEDEMKANPPIKSKLKVSASAFIPKSSSSVPDKKTLEKRVEVTEATISRILQSQTLTSASTTPIHTFPAPSSDEMDCPPLGAAFIDLDTTFLSRNKSQSYQKLFGIFFSKTNQGEQQNPIDYSNVILFEYASGNPQVLNGSRYLKFQKDELPLWFVEKNGVKPLLHYEEGRDVEGKRTAILRNSHMTLDKRRKIMIAWPAESNCYVGYEIWQMSDLKKEKPIYSSLFGDLTNQLDLIPVDVTSTNEFLESTPPAIKPKYTDTNYESRPGINGEEFEKQIGYQFKDKKILDLVLNHNLIREKFDGSNEKQRRIEKLGASVLDFLIHSYYYSNPLLNRHHNFRFILYFINNQRGKEYLTKLEILRFVNPNLIPTTEDHSPKIYMNIFQLILGAIFLDCTIEGVQTFFNNHFRQSLEDRASKAIKEQEERIKSIKPPIFSVPSISISEHTEFKNQDNEIENLKTYIESIKYQWKSSENFDKFLLIWKNYLHIENLIAEYLKTMPKDEGSDKDKVLKDDHWFSKTGKLFLAEQMKNAEIITSHEFNAYVNFDKCSLFIKILENLCINEFIIKKFPNDNINEIQKKSVVLLKAFREANPIENIQVVFLDSDFKTTQSIIQSLCEKESQEIFKSEERRDIQLNAKEVELNPSPSTINKIGSKVLIPKLDNESESKMISDSTVPNDSIKKLTEFLDQNNIDYRFQNKKINKVYTCRAIIDLPKQKIMEIQKGVSLPEIMNQLAKNILDNFAIQSKNPSSALNDFLTKRTSRLLTGEKEEKAVSTKDKYLTLQPNDSKKWKLKLESYARNGGIWSGHYKTVNVNSEFPSFFRSTVYVGDNLIGRGQGHKKLDAEQAAAKDLVEGFTFLESEQ